MTGAASPTPDTLLPPASAPAAVTQRKRGAPMFGHRPVGWGRHAGAVFGAAFASSLVQVLVGTSVAVTAMSMTGQSLGPAPVTVIGVGAFMLWCTTFAMVLGEIALFYTLARFLLSLAKRNFGAAYLALGLLVGMIEASAIGVMKGSTSLRQFIFAATTGVLAGFVYWLIAAGDREVVAREERAETVDAFR